MLKRTLITISLVAIAFTSINAQTVNSTSYKPATPAVKEPKLTAYQKLLLANKHHQSTKNAELYSYESEFGGVYAKSPNDIQCGTMVFDKKLVKKRTKDSLTLSFDGDEITVTCNNRK